MIKYSIVLADGREISSGRHGECAIRDWTITESVNSGRELTPGSVCCACLEMTIFSPDGELKIPVGRENALTLYRLEDGRRTQAGVFLPEKPERCSDHLFKLTAYDKVSLLDKDLSLWLMEIDWPEIPPVDGNNAITLWEFAGRVCEQCGVALGGERIPNGGAPVREFYQVGVTGRQLLHWVGEIACCFCHADASGRIVFAWYRDTDRVIRPTGEAFYYMGGLRYEDYQVAPVDAVRWWSPQRSDGKLVPETPADNPYIIEDDPIWQAQVGRSTPVYPTEEYRQVMEAQFAALGAYRPCRVEVSAALDIRPGDRVQVVTEGGETFSICVMTRVRKGQRDRLECTGSARRDSVSAMNDRSPGKEAQRAASSINASQILTILGAKWERDEATGKKLLVKVEEEG